MLLCIRVKAGHAIANYAACSNHTDTGVVDELANKFHAPDSSATLYGVQRITAATDNLLWFGFECVIGGVRVTYLESYEHSRIHELLKSHDHEIQSNLYITKSINVSRNLVICRKLCCRESQQNFSHLWPVPTCLEVGTIGHTNIRC